jgi:molybdopterin/thiamine biosynthesis adenylyltransferase
MIRTILVGAGGTGSLLARPLQHYLIATTKDDYELVIIDGDVVELKNLARQMFHPDDIESSKALRLASSLLGHPTAVASFLTPELAENTLREGDRVILAVDNYGVRALVDKIASEMSDFTVINPGNEDWTATCQVHIRRNGQNVTPRITYMHDEIAEGNMVPAAEDIDCAVKAVTGEEQTIGANMIAAAMALNGMIAVTKYDAEKEIPGFHETYFDLKKSIAGGPDWRTDGDGTWA